jgi:hypothetical protein
LENGHPLADHGEKFAFATFYARGFKTHLEHAIKVPNSIAARGMFGVHAKNYRLVKRGVRKSFPSGFSDT